jgi:hypothetical protein
VRRRLVFVTLITGVLALGMLGGTVAAQESDTDDGKRAGLLGRVAEILGIGEAELTDAFDQAKTEIHDERTDAFIDQAIEKGELTDEEIADLQERLDSGNFPRIGRGFHFGRGFGRHRDETTFTFAFRGDIGDFPEFDRALPDFEELRERLDQLEEDGVLRRFNGRGFRFHFDPNGDADGSAGETPGDETPTGEGVSL